MYFSDFTIKWASSNWEITQAHALRRSVFCEEQKLFTDHDQDSIDEQAQCIVAIANQGGWHEQVVGTVRIHQSFKSIWWGSRLAVHKDFRHQQGLGAALIKLAVCSAHGLGCQQFLAQVQQKNEVLFQKLNWKTQGHLNVHRQPHAMMEADLKAYPPCFEPYSGFVLSTRKPNKHKEQKHSQLTDLSKAELAPAYLQPLSGTTNVIKHHDGVNQYVA